MTKLEAAKVAKLLSIAYPTYYRNMKNDEAEILIDLLAESFANNSLNEVSAAIKNFIATDTKGYPPVIGAIKREIHKSKIPTNGTPHPDGGVWLNGKQVLGV